MTFFKTNNPSWQHKNCIMADKDMTERHEEWVEGLKSSFTIFLNSTNNRVESINQKIKDVIDIGMPSCWIFMSIYRIVYHPYEWKEITGQQQCSRKYQLTFVTLVQLNMIILISWHLLHSSTLWINCYLCLKLETSKRPHLFLLLIH